MEKVTSRQRSGKGAIRKRFPLQKPRWEKTKLTIRYLYHETIVSRMGSYFPNRWPLSYLNLTKNMKTYIRRQQHKKFLKTIFHVLFRLKIKINHINISIHVQKTKFHMRVYKLMTFFFIYCSTEPNYRLFPVFSAVLPVWAWLSICDVISYKSDKVRPLDNVAIRVMIMFILTINYLVLFYYEMILYAISKI